MNARVKLEGRTFGAATVESYQGKNVYRLRCACGASFDMRAEGINRGNAARGCGCRGRNPKALPPGPVPR